MNIQRNNLKFLEQTPLMSELSILNCIHTCSKLSQKSISQTVGLVPSMVNNYIKKLEETGYLKKQGKSNKDMEYFITPDGERRRIFLLISYMSEVIDLYKMAKYEFENRFQQIFNKDVKRVLFYGAGETGEVAIHSIKSFDIKVLGIVDDNPDLIGKEFYGYKIYCYNDIEKLRPDAIVITSFVYQDMIYDKINGFLEKGIKIFRIN